MMNTIIFYRHYLIHILKYEINFKMIVRDHVTYIL